MESVSVCTKEHGSIHVSNLLGRVQIPADAFIFSARGGLCL